MAKFNEKTNNYKKDVKKSFKKKPTYVKKNLQIAYSDFYADTIDSLYNLLNEISFDKISIPVKMTKAEFFGDKSASGTIVVGSVTKFNKDNSFTVSMTEENAKHITDSHVMNVRCYKDRENGDIVYITELSITNRFDSINEHFKDIEEAFTDKEEESKEEESETEEDADVTTE